MSLQRRLVAVDFEEGTDAARGGCTGAVLAGAGAAGEQIGVRDNAGCALSQDEPRSQGPSRSVTFDQPSSGIPAACQMTPRKSPRAADQPHADFPATEGGLEFIMKQISRLPTRWELTKYAFVILSVGAVLGIVGIEAFWRYVPVCGS